MKKWKVSLGALLLIPTVTIHASELRTLPMDEAVEGIILNDLNLQLYQNDTEELSNAARQYQSEFSSELEDLQEVQDEFNEKTAYWKAEYSAYQQLYQYLKTKESLSIKEESLTISLTELDLLEKKLVEGYASEQDIIQLEMNIANAELAVESDKKQLNEMKFSLNQALNLEILDSLEIIEVDDVQRLSTSSYDAEPLADQMMRTHESLIPLHTTVQTYEDIVDDAENLSLVNNESFVNNIEQAESEIEQIEAELSSLDPEDPTRAELTQRLQLANETLLRAEAAYSDAKRERSEAEDDLKEYYDQQIDKANINVVQQMNQLELKAYEYEEEFEFLHKKWDMLEQQVIQQEQLYKQKVVQFEEGDLTPTDLEKARLEVVDKKNELMNTQYDYALLKEEFRLFTEGYLPK
ncbi:TolC family protein [Bacillus solimangrovi]|uniref:TolC family protein n=1 Tax=Bacillus solimangrovi TaxID=1305675 RepID=A0A1E5LBV0_9BACI|nr:TolC family protein [Bacillus solimangrovi]OEH91568.1 hypothetical protein BFG57_04120 [Bacillus solimangrovi]